MSMIFKARRHYRLSRAVRLVICGDHIIQLGFWPAIILVVLNWCRVLVTCMENINESLLGLIHCAESFGCRFSLKPDVDDIMRDETYRATSMNPEVCFGMISRVFVDWCATSSFAINALPQDGLDCKVVLNTDEV